jgi:hypothetical protein
MQAKLATAAGGLALAVALGVPAGAQAAVSHSGSAYSRATGLRPEATAAPPCNDINDRATGGYATDQVDGLEVYFEPPPTTPYNYQPTEYCNISLGNTGRFEIVDYNTLQCLSVSTATTVIGEATVKSCDDAVANPTVNEWDQWTATDVGTYHSQTVWIFTNYYNGDCLYDDNVNSPAIYTPCSDSGAERFIWNALP